MRYCHTCILPDTRPGIHIEEDGVCNACKNANKKHREIDWKSREKDFRKLVQDAKAKSRGYDCLIPVSGGKDSHWQVIQCLEYGLNPLTVTWKTPARTAIGQKNLDNLVSLGVDHIDYQVNPKVEKVFMLKALDRFGSTAIPMHMAMFNMPLTIALQFDIHLIIWGENSALEYGTDEAALMGFQLDSRWLNKFGLCHGTTAGDWVDEDLSRKALTPYFGPGDQDLDKRGIRAVFLGYFFKWDTEKSYKAASEHGFKADDRGPRTGYYNYADIDDDFISIHHYLKWYKFGITRMFDNLSIEIRNKRIKREEAIQIIRERGDDTPYQDIKRFCDFVGITQKDFFKIIEKFRNPDIWKQEKGTWYMPDFIIPDWRWS